MKERKTEITVETYELLIVKQRGSLSRTWCASCGKHVAVISFKDACMSGLNLEAAQQLVEGGRLHLIETAVGFSFVCLDSLVRAVSIGQDHDPPANGNRNIQNQSEKKENL